MTAVAYQPVTPAPTAPQPDRLAGAVLHSLSRPLPGKGAWGLVKTVFLAGVTFGVAPLLEWPRRFADYVETERVQLLHLAEWMRLQSGHGDADELVRIADRMGAWPVLRWLPITMVIIVGLSFLQSFAGRFDLEHLLRVTYGWREYGPWVGTRGRQNLHDMWVIGLGVGYLAHWIQVLMHAQEAKRFMAKFNDIAGREGLSPMRRQSPGIGLRPMWLAAAVPGVMVGAWWAVPMVLAGAVQRRYISVSSVKSRGAIAERLRGMLMMRRPSMRVPMPVQLRRVCRRENCRAPLPVLAKFCPRCGTLQQSQAERFL